MSQSSSSSRVSFFLSVCLFLLSFSPGLSSSSSPLLVFVSVTSGPQHAQLREALRRSWLSPCRASPRCDYRFFVDAVPSSPFYDSDHYNNNNDNNNNNNNEHNNNEHNNNSNNSSSNIISIREQLLRENATHGDLVFRDACSLMRARHSALSVHYGNSPPIGENLFVRRRREHTQTHTQTPTESEKEGAGEEEEREPNPDYPLRRLYKIDWKTCFLKVIHAQIRSLDEIFAHVFVEDDSVVCMENLLFQLALVYNRTELANNTHTHTQAQNTSSSRVVKAVFRAGTPMFDGFDDSSTIMHRDIAKVFAAHYPSPGFNCSVIADSADKAVLEGASWLSWGNSWMSRFCHWTQPLLRDFGLEVFKPPLTCTTGKMNQWTIDMPCLTRPLILHHSRAGSLLLNEESPARLAHMCEHMLLIDKVKQPQQILDIYRHTAEQRDFHDFSDLFLPPKSKEDNGWAQVMKRLVAEETRCAVERRKARMREGQQGQVLNSTSALWEDPSQAHAEFPCLFEYYTGRARRQLWVREFLSNSDSTHAQKGNRRLRNRKDQLQREHNIDSLVIASLRRLISRESVSGSSFYA